MEKHFETYNLPPAFYSPHLPSTITKHTQETEIIVLGVQELKAVTGHMYANKEQVRTA